MQKLRPAWAAVAKLICHVEAAQRWVATMMKGRPAERFDDDDVEPPPSNSPQIDWLERWSLELVQTIKETGDEKVVRTHFGAECSGRWCRCG
jgi:hypothetical protein